MPADRLLVVGGSVAALVAADAALRRGRPVELLLPRRGVGGGFRPIELGGRRLPIGVRLLEIDREDAGPPPPLADYRPGPTAHAAFVRRVRDWVVDLVGDRLREVDRPAMALDGRLHDDIYFTVDLAGLRAALGEDAARRTAAEAGAARRSGGDAGVLGDGRDLLGCSLEEASRLNHGEGFHARFIAPMCAKIHPGGAGIVPAALRRKVWMPLFHPATLERAAEGRDTGYRPHRPFHTVEPGGMGDVVDALLARIRASALAAVTPVATLTSAARVGDAVTELRFADEVVRRAVHPVVGVGAGELFAAVGAPFAPGRVPMAMAWAEVEEADVLALPSVVHAPDPAIPAFRISPGGPGAPGRVLLVVELRHDIDPDDVPAAVRASLTGCGVVREGAPVEVVHRLTGPGAPDPSRDAMEAFAASAAALDRAALPAEIVGGAGAFGADSFNEQVIQGLRAEEVTR